jgi:hypothetical protein
MMVVNYTAKGLLEVGIERGIQNDFAPQVFHQRWEENLRVAVCEENFQSNESTNFFDRLLTFDAMSGDNFRVRDNVRKALIELFAEEKLDTGSISRQELLVRYLRLPQMYKTMIS